jgi:hypothetical protein
VDASLLSPLLSLAARDTLDGKNERLAARRKGLIPCFAQARNV